MYPFFAFQIIRHIPTASKIQFNKAHHFYLNVSFVNNNFSFMNKILTI